MYVDRIKTEHWELVMSEWKPDKKSDIEFLSTSQIYCMASSAKLHLFSDLLTVSKGGESLFYRDNHVP